MRRELVTVAREMRARGLTVATCGNVSVRTGDGMLITPTRTDPCALRPRDLVRCSLDGTVRRGQPSLEWPVHAAVYRERPDARAVVHTHSPVAIARSFDLEPLHVATEEAGYLGLDPITVVPWEPPGSESLARTAAHALRMRDVVLLERHGVLAVAETPRRALELCAVVEHLAVIDAHVRMRAAAAP